jgi:anaerobic selenocysteine-containing dehydrogenase
VVLISREDLERLGLRPNQLVTVRSAVGELRRQLVRGYDIRPGNALMYYPEANVLVPGDVDPLSKTPAFKSVSVEVVPERESPVGRSDLPLVILQS